MLTEEQKKKKRDQAARYKRANRVAILARARERYALMTEEQREKIRVHKRAYYQRVKDTPSYKARKNRNQQKAIAKDILTGGAVRKRRAAARREKVAKMSEAQYQAMLERNRLYRRNKWATDATWRQQEVMRRRKYRAYKSEEKKRAVAFARPGETRNHFGKHGDSQEANGR